MTQRSEAQSLAREYAVPAQCRTPDEHSLILQRLGERDETCGRLVLLGEGMRSVTIEALAKSEAGMGDGLPLLRPKDDALLEAQGARLVYDALMVGGREMAWRRYRSIPLGKPVWNDGARFGHALLDGELLAHGVAASAAHDEFELMLKGAKSRIMSGGDWLLELNDVYKNVNRELKDRIVQEFPEFREAGIQLTRARWQSGWRK